LISVITAGSKDDGAELAAAEQAVLSLHAAE
jgi:hypothetical protein